ncbi:hypothetical protein V7O66_01200 [Methanolobus sp. ZRKC3]|uniref:hypothetical protein n=1 Tax=Methanolobus sp. ZRKC3 TaxID=3125786 RepID=UPI0032545D68
MKNTGFKIIAYFAVAIMLVSVLSAGALAASDNGMNGNNGVSNDTEENESSTAEEIDDDNDDAPGIQQQDRDRDMVNADDDAPRNQNANKIRDKVKQAKDARANYMDAKDNFAKIKANNKNLDSEEALQAAKDYLDASIDRMISLIESNENIDDSYIEELEAEKEELAEASTRKELAEAARDINKIWKDARKEQVADSAKNINNRMVSVLRTSNALSVRLENEIQRLKDNGEDVEELEEMLDEYKEHITEAEENYEQARNTFREGDAEYGETLRYMNEAGKNINLANLVLKDILKDIKEYRQGVVLLSGTGTLEAKGEGTAVLSGDLLLGITATDAKLVVKDMAGDAAINTDDANYESSNIDSGNSDDNNRAFVFHDLSGNVTIEGSRLTVMLRGDDISLTAEGTGSVVLAGEGTYTTSKDGEITDGEWAESQYDEDDEEEVDEEVEDESDEDIEDSDDENGPDDDSTDSESENDEEESDEGDESDDPEDDESQDSDSDSEDENNS